MALSLNMRHIGPYVHQVGYALTAFPFGIALEQLANLKEQHDEDRLDKLSLGTGQKADEQCADSGHRHKEVLIEGFAMQQSFGCLLQRLMSDEQIGYKIDQQQLPSSQDESLLYPKRHT
jgi:hypothetical protein